MIRTSTLFLVLAVVAAPAAAATHNFQARLATPPEQARLISSELIWRCEGSACVAQGGMVDAPARLCARLARDAGKLHSFAVNGVGFDVDKLESCNARSAKRTVQARDASSRAQTADAND